MKKYLLVVLIFAGLICIRCGGNPEQEGDQAYALGKYNQALTYFLEVKKSNPDNPSINEKIALTYMQRGYQLYQKTKKVEPFSGNFEKGENFIPETETSEAFDLEYSNLLHKLGTAYHVVKPANAIQKEQYFSKTLDLLDLALTYNPDNQTAESTLVQIRADNFKETFEKGLTFFKQAKSEKNPDLFLSAEHYLNRAVAFDPENKDARKKLTDARKKTLSILDMDSDLPMAIADKQYSDGHLLIAFTAVNNTGDALDFDPAKLSLSADGDQLIGLDMPYTEKFDDGLIKKTNMAARKQLDGTLAFAIAKNKKIISLNYEMPSGKIIKKYLP